MTETPPPSLFAVNALASLANVAAIFYVAADLFLMTLTSERRHLTLGDRVIFCGIAIYAVSRLVASYGLRRLKKYGALLEIISAVAWLTFAVIVAPKSEMFLLLIPSVLSVWELWYFSRRSVRDLFVGWKEPGRPVSVVP